MKNTRRKLKDLTLRDIFLIDAAMMHIAREHLGKRIRYYHSQMDMDLLVCGHDYEELPKSYVIFICDFDPFGLGRYCYTFRSQCLEDAQAELGDEALSIVLSTRGKHPEEISPELEAFLAFVRTDGKTAGSQVKDPFVRKLQEIISIIKSSREMERRYMYLEDLLRHERKQAMAEGEARGKAEGMLETRRTVVLELLEELGEIPESLRERILSEKDADRLKHMHKAASKVHSIEAFEKLFANL